MTSVTVTQTEINASVSDQTISVSASTTSVTAVVSSQAISVSVPVSPVSVSVPSPNLVSVATVSSPVNVTVSSNSGGGGGGDTHDPVTIGTANGLSISGQVLSLGLASAGVTGALSGTDWSTFNGKQSALSFPLAPNLGGTGVNNGSNLLTVPETGTAALLATENVFTANQQTIVHAAIGAQSTFTTPWEEFYPGFIAKTILDVAETWITSTSGIDFIVGLTANLTADPPDSLGASSFTGYFAAGLEVHTDPTSDKDIGYMTGVYGSAIHDGSGEMEYLSGMDYYIFNKGDGTISYMYGVSISVSNLGTVDVSESYGLWVNMTGNAGSVDYIYGTRILEISEANLEAYGLYIDDITTAPESCAIYTNAGKVSFGGNLFLRSIKSGATQAGAGAAAGEVWKTSGHATLPNNVLMIGV